MQGRREGGGGGAKEANIYIYIYTVIAYFTITIFSI